MSSRAKSSVFAGAAAALLALGGCLERRMTIISDPPGATVTVNDVEIGRTPVSAAFTHYGEYEVQLELEGYEPIRAKANASTPIYELVPLDLVASAMPFTLSNEVVWKYVMQPEKSSVQERGELERELLERAGNLRQKIE